MTTKHSVIGKKVPRVDGRDMVTGRTKYVNDFCLPGMLFGKILRSPYAHAKIIDIDTSRAKQLPGVLAVITAEDIPIVKFGRDHGMEDETALAVNKVRYAGEPVAAVAAVDENTAQEAIELINVVYEELPTLLDPEEAMKPDAPLIHEEYPDNIRHRVFREFGDIEKAFKESDYIREDKIKTPMVQNATIATRCCLADYSPTTGKLTMYTDTQNPYHGRPLATILGIPLENIRFVMPIVGGSFGGRAGVMHDLHRTSAFLSMKTGKPVKIEHSRNEEFSTKRGRQPLTMEFKTGVSKDGKILAMHCRHITDCGAYGEFGIMNTQQDSSIFDLAISPASLRYDAPIVYTNTIPGRTLRALSNNAFGFGIYCHLDMVARDLGMDPAEFYLKNVHHEGDVTSGGAKLGSCGMDQCIREVVEVSGWKEKRGKTEPNRGIGLGLGAHTAGFYEWGEWSGERSTCQVNVDQLGEVRVLSGRGEYGNAPTTMICMCAAEELGLKLEDIAINDIVDTDVIPFEDSNYGSRGTVGQGRAAIAAAQDLRRQLFEVLAAEFDAKVEDMEARDGRIFVKGSPDKGVSFKDAVRAYGMSGKPLPLIGRGHYDPPGEMMDFNTGIGNVSVSWGFGAQVAEVAVDPETGDVKVLKVVTANDGGTVLNPLHLEGSSEGGIVMSLGMALFEAVRYDEKGRVTTTSFPAYGIPTALQTPEITHIWVETYDPYGPYGAKGVTEVVSLPTANAIANAVYDAVGVRIKELPITPDKVLAALKEKQKT